jgi:Na+-transporting NADH:ubiquinone oxidoreductase subunit D
MLGALKRSRAYGRLDEGLTGDNPIFRQVLGICSVLAVTNLVVNSVLMAIGLIFATSLTSLTVAALRRITPHSTRMIAQTLIIACYVIVFKTVIDAYQPAIAANLGAYVGLIITNCIVMGRAEAFANYNPPAISFFDGVGAGLGYGLVLVAVALVRELLGFGTIAGRPVLGSWWTKWTLMVTAPGALFVLATFTWIVNAVWRPKARPSAAGK